MMNKTIQEINEHKRVYKPSFMFEDTFNRWTYRIKMILTFALYDFDDKKIECLNYLENYYSKEKNHINDEIIERIKYMKYINDELDTLSKEEVNNYNELREFSNRINKLRIKQH